MTPGLEAAADQMTTHRAVRVASEAILLARDQESFRLGDLKTHLEFEDAPQPSDSTIRLVLQELEECDWLERKSPAGRRWYAGEHVRTAAS